MEWHVQQFVDDRLLMVNEHLIDDFLDHTMNSTDTIGQLKISF